MTAEELSRKVRGLELRARKMTGGLISGAYHSAFKGRGIEFLDGLARLFVEDFQLLNAAAQVA